MQISGLHSRNLSVNIHLRQRAASSVQTSKNQQSANDRRQTVFHIVFHEDQSTKEHHVACFGITQSKANMFIHLFTPLLRKTLNRLGELPKRNPYQLEQLLKNYDDILLDGTERPIQRPSDNQTDDEHYNGKKLIM